MSKAMKKNINVILDKIIKEIFNKNLTMMNSKPEVRKDGGTFWTARVTMKGFDLIQETQIAAYFHPMKQYAVRITHENSGEKQYLVKAHDETDRDNRPLTWTLRANWRSCHYRTPYYDK
jgi:hypothetical protein